MRRRNFRPAVEPIEVRIAPSALLAPAATTATVAPAPPRPPGTYPGTNPKPTTGPMGPGTS